MSSRVCDSGVVMGIALAYFCIALPVSGPAYAQQALDWSQARQYKRSDTYSGESAMIRWYEDGGPDDAESPIDVSEDGNTVIIESRDSIALVVHLFEAADFKKLSATKPLRLQWAWSVEKWSDVSRFTSAPPISAIDRDQPVSVTIIGTQASRSEQPDRYAAVSYVWTPRRLNPSIRQREFPNYISANVPGKKLHLDIRVVSQHVSPRVAAARTERVDVAADFARFFGESYVDSAWIVGVIVMADSNQTDGETRATVADITLTEAAR